MKDVAIVSYARTAIGKANRGALNNTHGIPMLAHVLKHAVDHAGIAPAEVEDVVVGCGLPEGATGHNVARNAALWAGFGVEVPGITINRYCGSGVSAISIAATRIAAGDCNVIVAGGVESISLVQTQLNYNGFFYEPLQQQIPSVWYTMIQTADIVARKYNISREAQDEYSLMSQQRVAAAKAAGKFAEEIVPFDTVMKLVDKATGATSERAVTINEDEGPRPDSTLEALTALKPVQGEGNFITAGNASQLSDGAAAVVLMDAKLAQQRGIPILGLFRGMQVAAVTPAEMSIANKPAVDKLLRHHSLSVGDVNLWELHEAFAVTALYAQRELGVSWDIANVNGGAVVLGHPYGMSGIRYVGSILREMNRRKAKRGVVTTCTAGGMATACLLEVN